jgi:hypothetical protein
VLLGSAFSGQRNRVIFTIARFGKTAVIVLGVPFSAVSYAAGGAFNKHHPAAASPAGQPSDAPAEIGRRRQVAIFDLLDYEAQAM